MPGIIVVIIAFWVIVNSVKKMQKPNNAQKANNAQPQQPVREKQGTANASHELDWRFGSLGESVPMQSSEGLSAYKPIEHRLSTAMGDSQFIGSLGVDSTEGMDICDPSLEHSRSAAASSPVIGLASSSSTASDFAMDKGSLLQGVIMSEILTRPQQRKWGRCSHG